MKYTAKEFIELVMKMRALQVKYRTTGIERNVLLNELRVMERQIDEAEITDISNLETNQPLV